MLNEIQQKNIYLDHYGQKKTPLIIVGPPGKINPVLEHFLTSNLYETLFYADRKAKQQEKYYYRFRVFAALFCQNRESRVFINPAIIGDLTKRQLEGLFNGQEIAVGTTSSMSLTPKARVDLERLAAKCKQDLLKKDQTTSEGVFSLTEKEALFSVLFAESDTLKGTTHLRNWVRFLVSSIKKELKGESVTAVDKS